LVPRSLRDDRRTGRGNDWIGESDALRIVLRKPSVCSVQIAEDLKIDTAFRGVDVNPNDLHCDLIGLGETLGTLVGEPEKGAADVHVDQAVGLQLLDAGTVILRPAAFAQEYDMTFST
jgi:hypothetical protein